MILSAGLRTDLVAAYPMWLYNRFKAGFVYARNPLFPGRVTYYELKPNKVDALYFCSKSYINVLSWIGEIGKHFRTLFHCTVNGYGTDVEQYLPPLEDRIQAVKELSRSVGKERVFWRYDPILLTEKYDTKRHFELFEEIGKELSPYVSGCIISFVEMFPRISQRMAGILPLSNEEKVRIAKALNEIAAKYRLNLRICGADDRYRDVGVYGGGCVTLDDISKANGCAFRAVPHHGNKRGCYCITSRDIGWYDSCPLGCKYCNANRDLTILKENLQAHDPDSPILIGKINEDDVVLRSSQASYIRNDGRQISLFDL